jgi:glycerol-3-phosphate dehydrogenase
LEETGAILVAATDEDCARLPELKANAENNGVTAVRMLSAAEVRQMEPHLKAEVLGGLLIEQESITCAFTAPIAYATQAVVNGVQLFLETEVTGVTTNDAVHHLSTTKGPLSSRYVINAAGLWGDVVDGFWHLEQFHIKPRRGEFIIFDKPARRLLQHILLPVPTPKTKGVLIAPTIYGNVLLGPTADDIEDRQNTSVTKSGLDKIRQASMKLLPDLIHEDVTALYSGIRSATEFSDYQIKFHNDHHYVTVGGIRSTGLSAALAIAKYVVEGLADMGLSLQQKGEFTTIRMPNISEFAPRPYQQHERICENPRYGHIVCHCELVSEGEIIDAIQSPLGARTLNAIRKRTRATMGRCQGFNCLPHVMNLLAKTLSTEIDNVMKESEESKILV